MTRPIIEVEHISKRYRLGQFNAQSLGEEAERLFSRRRNGKANEDESEFWALKNVSFTVTQGEVLGIIGRNGAGKSTLLKILSRVTEPTSGEIRVRGRAASLLEVGTGFHPELTGRENIYLNGAILGMTRAEIKAKFDEIVAFAEVEKFLDTPVKRYSSGMYVRLAFAVAAHLEPEILIVDEVLAVGDAEFQKKCLGKMGEVASHGRTILFVSHNMSAVQKLCERSILIWNGRSSAIGSTGDIVARYLGTDVGRYVSDGDLRDMRRRGEGNVRFRRIAFLDRNGLPLTSARTGEELNIALEFDGSLTERRFARIGIDFHDARETPLFLCNESSHKDGFLIGAGDKMICRIPRLPLSAGRYKISLFLERNGVVEDALQDYVWCDVTDGSFFGTARNTPLGWEGRTVLVDHEWHQKFEFVDPLKGSKK